MTPHDFLLRMPPLKVHVRNATQTNGEPAVYELFCRLTKTREKQDDPPEAEQWSLWKTYEEFQAFDSQMRAARQTPFAKMMVTVAFAPGHRVRAFFHQDQTPSFLEKRRAELDFYMQRVMLFPDVVEFTKRGSGCKVLADFIGAQMHMDCSGLLPLNSPATTVSAVFSSSGGFLRGSSDSDARASCTSGNGGGEKVNSRRKMCRLEIEEELALRGGAHELKRFKKRARAFRKENDPMAAAQPFVAFLNKEYEPEFALWVLRRFVRSLKSYEKREVLCSAGGISIDEIMEEELAERESQRHFPQHDHGDDDDDAARQSKKYEMKIQSFSGSQTGSNRGSTRGSTRGSESTPSARSSRKKANRQILERVTTLSRGDVHQVSEFKQAAKALGSQEMSGQAFVDYLRSTFGKTETQELLLLVVDVIPQPQVQQELRVALTR